MSFPTQQAFVHYGGWDDELRKHPAMNWMEQYTKVVDDKVWNTEPHSKWLTDDHKLQRTTGEVISGGEASWKALREEVYAPFATHLHDPLFCVTWEVDGGWEMIGVADMYWSLAVPGDGPKVKSKDGKEFDGKSPAGFYFGYAKQSDGGIKLKKSEIFTDPTAAVVGMLKRGMMKPEDLMR